MFLYKHSIGAHDSRGYIYVISLFRNNNKKSGTSHNTVRHWRIYAALTTVVFGIAGGTLLLDAVTASSTQDRNNVNVFVDSGALLPG